MNDQGPLGQAEVDAFYHRQRQQIMERLCEERESAGGSILQLRRRSWIGLGLAAAAALVLTTIAFLRPQEFPPGPATDGGFLSEIQSEASWLPLPEYSPRWDDEPDSSPVPGVELESLSWLLSEEELSDSEGPVPEFLEPFGAWTGATAPDEST